MRTQRIKVQGRRFAYKVGITFIGVWEQRSLREWLFRKDKTISFVFPRPDEVKRDEITEMVARRIGGVK